MENQIGQPNVENATECMIMKDTIRRSAFVVIGDVTSCIGDKIELAETYLANIFVAVIVAEEKIIAIKREGEQCVQRVNGAKEIAGAIACVTKATVKGAIEIGKAIPKVSINISKLIREIATLHIDLPICMSTKGLLALAEQASLVVASINDCVKSKLEGKNRQMLGYTDNEYDNEIVDLRPFPNAVQLRQRIY